MRKESFTRKFTVTTLSTAFAALLLAAPALGASMEEQEQYSMSMKQEIEMVRDKVAALEGDSKVEQAWEEAAGDWGRLQLATQQQWQDAKAEFEESWEALEKTLEEAVQ
ncbi:hypothetical protein [Limibacillus halophilus]